MTTSERTDWAVGPDSEYLGKREIAEWFGVTVGTAQTWLSNGRIPSLAFGGAAGRRATRGDCRAFLARLRADTGIAS